MGLFIILNQDDAKLLKFHWEILKKDMDKFREAIKSFLIKVVIKTISNTQFKNIKFIPN